MPLGNVSEIMSLQRKRNTMSFRNKHGDELEISFKAGDAEAFLRLLTPS